MAALSEAAANPNRFAHGEAMARKRASSSEKRNSKTSIIGSLMSGEGSRSRTNSQASTTDDAGVRARDNWKKAGISVRAMLRFKQGPAKPDVSEGGSQASDIPDRFAHGLKAAHRKSAEQKAASSGKKAIIKRMSSGGSTGGGTRSRGNSAASNDGAAA